MSEASTNDETKNKTKNEVAARLAVANFPFLKRGHRPAKMVFLDV